MIQCHSINLKWMKISLNAAHHFMTRLIQHTSYVTVPDVDALRTPAGGIFLHGAELHWSLCCSVLGNLQRQTVVVWHWVSVKAVQHNEHVDGKDHWAVHPKLNNVLCELCSATDRHTLWSTHPGKSTQRPISHRWQLSAKWKCNLVQNKWRGLPALASLSLPPGFLCTVSFGSF